MSKVKWFAADFEIPFENIAVHLQEFPFDDGELDSEGFRLELVSRDKIVGQHIEKETYVHQVALPNGSTYDEQRSIFTITQFVIHASGSLNLVLNDPPRKVSTFINSFARALSYQVSIRFVEVDILIWIDHLEQNSESCVVKFLDCNSIKVSDKTIGRFVFKGADDVRCEAKLLLHGRDSSIESAKCDLLFDGRRHHFELYRAGVVKSASHLDIGLLRLVAKTLLKSLPSHHYL
jgi:hypothetical protein